MKYKNITIEKPLYTHLKSHRCLKCGSLTRVDKISKIVNTNSKEFKAYAYKFFDSYPIGEVEFVEEEFVCNNCDFHMPVNSYFRLEKMIKRMEREVGNNRESKNINYLYEDEINYAFSRKWCCMDCNTQMPLGFQIIKKASDKESFFKSFIINDNNGEAEHRRLHLECKNCDKRIAINEVEENVNVIKCKFRKSSIRIIQFIFFCIVILLFILLKRS